MIGIRGWHIAWHRRYGADHESYDPLSNGILIAHLAMVAEGLGGGHGILGSHVPQIHSSSRRFVVRKFADNTPGLPCNI